MQGDVQPLGGYSRGCHYRSAHFDGYFCPAVSSLRPKRSGSADKLQKPSGAHWLGTDDLGRDILSRIIYGSRISLLVGVVAVLTGGVIGMGLGLIAGHFGGWIFTIIMRFVDALMALPPLILIMAIAAVLGGGLTNVLIALSIGMLPVYCPLNVRSGAHHEGK